ncbi:MAG: beta-(1-6) glucans synthase [Proteobacteria bacterium]|nr:beta-(1-6) glucans synthase [Pseudomonadota bacterium]
MPEAPLPPGAHVYCVSYAPFRGAQTPLDPSTLIEPAQIDEDLARLARLTDCVRVYSVDQGLDKVPELAERHGLKVLLGIWISSETKRNQDQIRAGVSLAKRYPNTVRALIIGNEVLLRGEMRASTLEALIRQVKAQVQVPVTYADVWEFWLKNSGLAKSVDFVTVHILPYWEDDPIPASAAASHISSIRARVAQSFPGKEVIIGEAGWPSRGRMREGALPSPANQALVMHGLVAAARTQGFRVNLIEAFDQPWKRHLEGTVGGHWGLYTDAKADPKFVWGEPVSNHPYWPWEAAAGLALAAATGWVAIASRRGNGSDVPFPALPLALIALASGSMLGEVVEAAWFESLGLGGWLRSLSWLAVSLASPLLCALAFTRGIAVPALAEILGPRPFRAEGVDARAIGWLLIAVCILAAESALGLTFNPRYRDFPFAAMTAAVLPLALLSAMTPLRLGARPIAEGALAVMLCLCAIKIVAVEGLANWQAIWFAAIACCLTATLARARIWQG